MSEPTMPEALRKAVSGSSFYAGMRILPKAGHWPHFESPEPTRRMVAAYLGLPLLSSALHTPLGDDELKRIEEIAAFLAHSNIGNNMSRAQRTRLAGQLRQISLPAYRRWRWYEWSSWTNC